MTVAELERRLGDPWDAGNPLAFGAVLAADEREEMFADGEQLLHAYGLGSEFVPVALGGRMDRLDRLVDVMRAVFRRDACLGLGYGASSFIASVNVWAAGSPEQQRHVADLLLDRSRVASVYHELAHGNDFSRAEFRARPVPDGRLELTGRKEVVTNLHRAQAMVLFARTSDEPGSRSHSQLLVDRTDLDPARVRDLPRFHSAGMRGVQLGGIELDRCVVPRDRLLGSLGGGIETALRSFQLTRTALPAMALGVVDSGLRTTLRLAHRRTLYGAPVLAIPHVRANLAEAFVDLLIGDAMARSVARALHVIPAQTAVHASAAKYVVSGRLLKTMATLSSVMGSSFYVRNGEFGIFQKQLRDLAPAGFGHAARVACLGTMLPQLPRLARLGWDRSEPAPATIFDLDHPLPSFAFDALRVSSAGTDGFAAALTDAADPLEVRNALQPFVDELEALRTGLRDVPPSQLGVSASPAALDMAAAYASVLTASACANVWRVASRRGTAFLGEPTWLLAALHRVADQLVGGIGRVPPQLSAPVLAELLERHRTDRTFDLAAYPLA